MPKFVNLKGLKVEHFTVLKQALHQGRRTAWLCRCICGKKVEVLSWVLVGHHKKSCGCKRADRSPETLKRRRVNLLRLCIDSRLKRAYGISYQDREEMFTRQKGKCAICKCKMSGKGNVDHNHTTDQVRELLCTYCNHLLGNAKESVQILKSAMKYLRRHNGKYFRIGHPRYSGK